VNRPDDRFCGGCAAALVAAPVVAAARPRTVPPPPPKRKTVPIEPIDDAVVSEDRIVSPR
jgi:hypothetical protein